MREISTVQSECVRLLKMRESQARCVRLGRSEEPLDRGQKKSKFTNKWIRFGSCIGFT